MSDSTEQWLDAGRAWFATRAWTPFTFQEDAWRAYLQGYSGMVNAPTGSGKTYALAIPILLEYLREQAGASGALGERGLRAIWVTPIRALAKEIQQSIQAAAEEMGLQWQVALRTGDTPSAERERQKKQPPEVLIITPESLHLLLATKGYPQFFCHLRAAVIDEWHELLGSKRGVLVELALSRLKALSPGLKIWGISATIGNMDEALAVLLGDSLQRATCRVIRADIDKRVEVRTILPDEIETFPWAGHLGIKLLDKVIPIIEQSKSTLIFTNTRAQCEIWYQRLLEAAPHFAGAMAMHHGSIDRHLRDWVEEALHEGILKVVVCTSSLDLGVDFRPVETIVQIGSPKGVARFIQRAGRSGHQPGATSSIYFAPTHSLELIEGSALREAIAQGRMEQRIPHIRSFDVLTQYLVTLAVSEGFRPAEILREIRGTHAFASISDEEWAWALHFISSGGASLRAYDEYKKVSVENGLYKVLDRRVALRHRLSIGVIASDGHLQVKYVGGPRIGAIEEWFVAQLKPGDVFWFAGRSLELARIKDMTVQVRKSEKKTGKVPSWQGGKMPLSSQLSEMLRERMDMLARDEAPDDELAALRPLVEAQRRRSRVPAHDELLIEYFPSREGRHLLIYPFEGRYVHEGLGSLLAYRIARLRPISFSIAMNDYGLELLSDQEIPIEEALADGLFSEAGLGADIRASINAAELAKRRFRDIAAIAGLVFKGYPGNQKKERHLQASAQLFFEVFNQYEPDNLLLLQAFEEVMSFQLEEARLREALRRVATQRIVLAKPAKATPFSFPIIVDRLRERLSSEKLEDRVRKMKLRLID